MYKHPTHFITKETRARNLVVRDRTRKVICEYIYEQTACEKCKVGHFCSRDGDKWGCVPYGNIASHLNHIDHPTSLGNKWSNKTVRDQIQRGMKKVTSAEKLQWQKEQDRIRDSEVIWETVPLDIFEHIFGQELVDIDELMERAELGTNLENIEDVNAFTNELREHLTKKVELGLGLSLILFHRKPRDN
jgi:hypothetical protein